MNDEPLKDKNCFKCRNSGIVYFTPTNDPESKEGDPESKEGKEFNIIPPFSEYDGFLPGKKETPFGVNKLRQYIEPWLTALFQSEHLSLLVGAGLPYAIQEIADTEKVNPAKQITRESWGEFLKYLDIPLDDNNKNANTHSLERNIRKATQILDGLQHISTPRSKVLYPELNATLDKILRNFISSVLSGERTLWHFGMEIQPSQKDKIEEALKYLVRFLMSFASRSGTRERLQIFTTNYDRYIEMGADLAGLRLLDRFAGALTPLFRSSRLDVDMHYNPPGIRGEPRYVEGVARFTKLHGSLDWVDTGEHIRRIAVPFGTNTDLYLRMLRDFQKPGEERSSKKHVMVYPNSCKDRDTAEYPYVDLFRDFAASICRPNNTLVCYGYSFGDSHINRVIEDMLTIPSTHLVIISNSILPDLCKKWGNHSQVTFQMGPMLGNLKKLSDYYLPKPAIDRITIKMADLLKVRLTDHLNSKDNQDASNKKESS